MDDLNTNTFTTNLLKQVIDMFVCKNFITENDANVILHKALDETLKQQEEQKKEVVWNN
jgi:transcriptional regulator CtsR